MNAKFYMRFDALMKFSCTFVLALCIALFAGNVSAQTPAETPPPPGEPTALTLPEVSETTLPNGLKVVVVQRTNVPLVTASLLVKKGAAEDGKGKAGVASTTADLLTQGTSVRTATEIAQQMEFLGATIFASADWNASEIRVNVMKDKLGKALSIMSDTILRPSFPQKELDLYRKRLLDGYSVSLKEPGSLLSYAAAVYSYGEHPVSGTPETIKNIRRQDVTAFHAGNYLPENSVLIFTGDISPESAFGYARLFFGGWESGPAVKTETAAELVPSVRERPPVVARMLVIDLPDSGQSAVGFVNRLDTGRTLSEDDFFAATVLNSVLGGGYSARLNQEIRLKRGLSYGARSGFDWRMNEGNFLAVAQTKDESAGQVAELMKLEIEKLITESISSDEMTPRKAVVAGGFGRSLQTNNGLAQQLAVLYSFGLTADKLNSFMPKVRETGSEQIKSFANDNLSGGDIIIVGDASKYLEDLKARFPEMKIQVIKASKINLNKKTLR